MAEINTKTKIFTQRRITLPGEKGPWQKICNGHENMEEAILCAEKAKAILLGTYVEPNHNPVNEAMNADIRATYLTIIAAGGSLELCLSKFTVTREMVEDFGPIVRENKIQPKKEVS